MLIPSSFVPRGWSSGCPRGGRDLVRQIHDDVDTGEDDLHAGQRPGGGAVDDGAVGGELASVTRTYQEGAAGGNGDHRRPRAVARVAEQRLAAPVVAQRDQAALVRAD